MNKKRSRNKKEKRSSKQKGFAWRTPHPCLSFLLRAAILPPWIFIEGNLRGQATTPLMPISWPMYLAAQQWSISS
jgi:hypothetical protein